MPLTWSILNQSCVFVGAANHSFFLEMMIIFCCTCICDRFGEVYHWKIRFDTWIKSFENNQVHPSHEHYAFTSCSFATCARVSVSERPPIESPSSLFAVHKNKRHFHTNGAIDMILGTDGNDSCTNIQKKLHLDCITDTRASPNGTWLQ